MSALQKLFQKKFCRKSRSAATPAVIELPRKDEKPHEEPSVFVGAMPPPYLRLVLFQEEGCERRLLFDSKSFEPQKMQYAGCRDNGESPTSNTGENGRRSPCMISGRPYQHVYVRGPQDSDVLSEMLFGTVGMASRASSLKIHIMKDPQRLMLSRVFCVESAKETGSFERGLDTQRPSSRRKAKTLPVPTPTPEPAQPSPMSPYQSLASSLTKMTRSDSSSSLMSLLGASFGATGSLGSRPTSNPIVTNKSHSLPPVRQSSRDSFTLTQEPHSGILSRRTKVKIGFAVIFRPEPSDSSEFQQFFFEHFPLVESYVTFLKEQVENALNSFKRGGKAEFIENMMDALNTFTSRIQSIYSTPRLSRPVWPTLMSQSTSGLPWNGDDVTIKCFISELARMVNQHNTKQKNFFMTGLVTSALTHHLGWVNTTMLGNENDRESRMMTYNPLWAQLGDLYGAVGTPTKVAKTVVVGEIHEVVSTIISVLSYFIRCSAVKEVVKVPNDFSPQAFCKDTTPLKMSFVPSDLELSDYVLVDMDEKAKSVNHDEESNCTTPTDSKLRDSFRKSHRNKSITSQPIDVARDQKTVEERGSVTSNGSVLCRSRSSPATSSKPQVKFHRQQSSGNFETASPRARTNSNDTFAKPRSVQSRRTSRNAHQPTSHSASTKSIPDAISFLEVATNPLVKSDCHDNNHKPTNENEPTQNGLNNAVLPIPRPRTHKRVSSEPFTISNLKSEDTRAGLTKTKSTYFQPVRQETFVENLEPKVINLAHVQRATPVLAQSPNLERSTRTLGFKTNGKVLGEQKTKSKHPKSVTVPEKLDFNLKKTSFSHPNTQNVGDNSKTSTRFEKQENDVKSPSKTTPKTAPVVPNAPKFDFNQEKSQRSVSTGNAVRRNSSGKPKIAARRKNLNNLPNKNTENDRPLPPFQRIPSISLEHDEFVQYFSEDEKDEVTFFVGTDNQSSISCDQSTKSNVNHNHSNVKNHVNGLPTGKNSNSDVTIALGIRPSLTKTEGDPEKQSTVTTSAKQRAENVSTVQKRPPPPLPLSRPVGRKPPVHPSVMKPPPPLPTTAPVHKGSLYPNLAKETCNPSQRPTDLALPQSSLYPRLKPVLKPKPGTSKLTTPPNGSLYPSLIDCDQTTPKSETPKEENSPVNLSMKLQVPLRVVDVQSGVTKESSDHDDKKLRKLNYGDLIADYSPEYLWGFALHGTRNQPSLFMNVMRELRQSTSIPVLDEQISESVTIIADTDKWSVKVLSSHRIHSDKLALPALNSKLVNEILEKIKKLYQMSVPAIFCMQQLEQSLGELVMKSKMLADYVCGNTRVKMPQLSAILGIESSDLPLLMAIASCHSPEVGAKLLY